MPMPNHRNKKVREKALKALVILTELLALTGADSGADLLERLDRRKNALELVRVEAGDAGDDVSEE